MKHWIEQANAFGKQREPFLFLIDFEQQKPLIVPLAEAKQYGLYFEIEQHSNRDWQESAPQQPLQLQPTPMPLARYQQGFELVQQLNLSDHVAMQL
ncbi:MAG: hypothetical protein Q4G54_08695 [Pelistega sp.]|nr:hypothetical protein [Pelistega sp.]